MPIVKPFKALRYNTKKIRDLSRVVAPPYDIIPKSMQNALYKKDPHNMIRLILNRITPKDAVNNNRYTRSRKFFDLWIKDNILIRDDEDSFYIYSQKYRDGNKNVEQIGFIGLMCLEMRDKDKILPHENTLAAPKKDRLNLMRSVKANLSPIFILHDDKAITRALKSFRAKNKAIIDISREGIRHTVWKTDDHKILKMIEDHMKDKNVFIADGHHRHEVAKMYSKEVQDSASKYTMAYFVEADEKMLTVLPAHRLIKDLGTLKKDGIMNKLKEFFHIEKVSSLDRMMLRLRTLSDTHAFGVYLGKNKFYLLKLKDITVSDKIIKNKSKEWKRLDVSILHLFIFQHVLGIRDVDENIEFVKDPMEAAKAIDSHKFKAAFFLNPTKVSQVKRIAKMGERMPRKATYFYPKQLTGLVINKF